MNDSTMLLLSNFIYKWNSHANNPLSKWFICNTIKDDVSLYSKSKFLCGKESYTTMIDGD